MSTYEDKPLLCQEKIWEKSYIFNYAASERFAI